MKKEEMGILDYIRRLKNRRRMMAYVFIAVFLAVAAATFVMKPVYKAVAEIYIDPGYGSQLNLAQGQSLSDNTVYLQTQLSILQSESIARSVVSKLNLDRPETKNNNGLTSYLAGMMSFLGSPKDNSSESRMDEAVRKFERHLKADYAPTSNVIDVSYEAEDPALAAQVVNTAVQSLIQQNVDFKVAPAKEALSWLDGKLSEIRASMNETANRLQNFKTEKDLIVTGEKDSNISYRALTDLNASVLAAEVKRSEAEVKYRRVMELAKQQGGYMSLPEVINNKLVQDLKAQQADLQNKYAELSKQYGDKHPQMVRLKSEVAALQNQVGSEVALIVASIKDDYQAALHTERILRASLQDKKAEAMNYERRSAEYDLRKQDIQGAQDIYQAVLKKFQESNIMGNLNVSNVQFLHRAVPPFKPDRPRKGPYLVFGFVLAVMCSVGFGLIAEYLDNTFKSPDDIEENLGVSVLGIVPRNVALLPGKGGVPALPRPASAFAEAFRNIKGNILLRSCENPQVIQVGSALSGEGKSIVALNLACSLALAGEDVVIIDADLRQPSLHRYLKLSKGPGLCGILAGRAGLEGAVLKTEVSNLSFIPAGLPTGNSGELLRSAALIELLNDLRTRFDRVIIDSPPYLGPVDSYLMATLSDGVVLVVLSGKTGKDMLSRALKDLNAIKANVLGCVLNDVNSESQPYYHYYYEYLGNESENIGSAA